MDNIFDFAVSENNIEAAVRAVVDVAGVVIFDQEETKEKKYKGIAQDQLVLRLYPIKNHADEALLRVKPYVNQFVGSSK